MRGDLAKECFRLLCERLEGNLSLQEFNEAIKKLRTDRLQREGLDRKMQGGGEKEDDQ